MTARPGWRGACLTGHWLVGHLTHRHGPAGWMVDGAAVRDHDMPAAPLITFGEAWHGNHHAWPDSARLSLNPAQPDQGWWVLLAMCRMGLVRNLKQPKTCSRGPGRTGQVRPRCRAYP